MPRCAAFLALTAAAIVLWGCGRTIERTANARINAILPRYLGPADRYETRIDADSTGALMRGRLRGLHIVGTNVRLRPELLVAHLTIDAEAVEVDTKRHTLSSVGSAAFAGTVEAADLDRYVRSRVTDVPGLAVGIEGDKLTVHARPQAIGVIPVPVTARGALRPVAAGDHLDFLPDRAAVTIVPIPGIVLDFLSRKLNPVIDLTDLPVPIHVDSVVIADGAVTMRGTIAPEAILGAAK